MTDSVVRIKVDEQERCAGRLGAEKAGEARNALLTDGVVVLTGAVDPVRLEPIRTQMTADLEVLRQRSDVPENFAHGHLQQDPPPRADLLIPEVLAAGCVTQVCRAALGQPLRLTSYSANTNVSGSELQDVHVDEGQCWPDLTIAHPPARLVVNVPLTDADALGGAIEVWPGTHLDTRVTRYASSERASRSRALDYVRAARRAKIAEHVNRRVGLTVSDAFQAERRRQRPPEAVETDIGSVIIRDPRVWHRGTPNGRERTRFMLAMIYDPHWRGLGEPIEFPSSCRPVIKSLGVDVSVRFVEGEVDYLNRHRPPPASPLKRATNDSGAP